MAQFGSPWAIGDRVHMDDDRDLVGRVTGLCWREAGHTVEVSWVHNGAAQCSWFDHWRLTVADR